MGLLRVALALSVLASHTSPVLGLPLIGGPLAVRIFFAISGFYIAMILTKKYTSLLLFYTNRVLRLWPAYIFVFGASVVWFYVVWSYIGYRPPPDWIPQAYAEMAPWQLMALRLSNLSMIGLDVTDLFHYREGDGFFFLHCQCAVDAPDGAHWASHFNGIGQAWSISSELWFYLLAPFLVKRGLASLALIAMGSAALNLWMEANGFAASYFFPALLCFFVAGMIVYKISQMTKVLSHQEAMAPYWLGLIFAVFVLFGQMPEKLATFLVYATVLPALPVLFSRFQKSAWDTAIANLSYPIYLSHMLVAAVFSSVAHTTNGTLVASVTIAVSIGISVLIEKPMDRLRQRRFILLSHRAIKPSGAGL